MPTKQKATLYMYMYLIQLVYMYMCSKSIICMQVCTVSLEIFNVIYFLLFSEVMKNSQNRHVAEVIAITKILQ